MKIFDPNYINALTAEALANNPRKRQYRDIYVSYEDPCQRLFNAIEPGSYIPSHSHASDPNQPKDLALWAPDEGTKTANDYLNRLMESVV